MRIKVRHHASDRKVHELALWDLFDIALTNLIEDIGKAFERLEW